MEEGGEERSAAGMPSGLARLVGSESWTDESAARASKRRREGDLGDAPAASTSHGRNSGHVCAGVLAGTGRSRAVSRANDLGAIAEGSLEGDLSSALSTLSPAHAGSFPATGELGKGSDPGPSFLSPEVRQYLRKAMREEIFNVCLTGEGFPVPRPQSLPHTRPTPSHPPKGTWPTKAAQKQNHCDIGEEGDQFSEGCSEDGDDREFLSDEEAEEADTPEASIRFFKFEDYQFLLTKTLSALEIQDASQGEDSRPSMTNPRNKTKGSKEFLPTQSVSPKVFPFPEFFERQIKAEWQKPSANKQFPSLAKKLYDLPPFANEMLQVPLVDAPVVDLQSPGLLSEDGQGSVRDNLDKRVDTALRRTHEAIAMTIKASVTTSMVCRAAIVWARKLLQLLPENNRRVLEGATRLLKAASFSSDASLDAATFASRAMASSAVARRGIWLRAWPADLRAKNIVSSYPFQGEKLFGEALERILIETKDKKKAMPKTIRRPDRRGFDRHSFRNSGSSSLSRVRTDFKKSHWNPSRPTFRRNFNNSKFFRSAQGGTDKADRDGKPGKA